MDTPCRRPLTRHNCGQSIFGGCDPNTCTRECFRALERVSIKAVPLFHGAEIDPTHAMTAERIRNSMRAEYEALGYQERHDALMKVAEDLEAASADLPAIAAEVFMESKRVADDLRAEAAKGLAEWQAVQEKTDGAE